MATATTEDAVRRYLLLAKDPDKLVDTNAIEQLHTQLENSSDPIERIKLRAQIEQAKQPPAEELEAAFIKDAKTWAEENDIPAEALIAEGADPSVLRQAGFHIARGPRKTTKQSVKRQKTGASETNGRRKGATEDAIKHIRRTRKPFTAPDVINATNVSRSTATKAINQLIEDGEVEDTGEERESGRGRNAKIYQRTS